MQNPPALHPYGTLAIDSAGNLFGVAQSGGMYTFGSVWKLAAGGSAIQTLGLFNWSGNGAGPQGATLDIAGNVIGVTDSAGPNSAGTLWEVPHATTSPGPLQVLWNYYFPTGANPMGTVTFDSHGNMYGTTTVGGSPNGNPGNGVVWQLPNANAATYPVSAPSYNPAAWTVLFRFDGTNNPSAGYGPQGPVSFDSQDNMFGTTMLGGAAGQGTIWEIPKGGSYRVLASFSGTTGSGSKIVVTLDANGNLYGTTPTGGGTSGGQGTVWKLPKNANGTYGALTVLAVFDGVTNGKTPNGGVTIDRYGNLLGTTSAGNQPPSGGTVWEIKNNNGVYSPLTTLYNFTLSNQDVAGAYSGLVLDSHGNLWGTTHSLGANHNGTVYKMATSQPY